MSKLTEEDVNTRRLRSCVEAWPEAHSGDYHPNCCRFPKSCSPHGYIQAVLAGNLKEEDLEPPEKNEDKVEWDIDRNLPMSESVKLDCVFCGDAIQVQIYKNSGWCSQACMRRLAASTMQLSELTEPGGQRQLEAIKAARQALGLPSCLSEKE